MRAIARSDLCHEMPAIGCADNCAATRHDPGNLVAIEHLVFPRRQQPLESIDESNDFPAEFVRGKDHSTKDRIQAGTITPAR